MMRHHVFHHLLPTRKVGNKIMLGMISSCLVVLLIVTVVLVQKYSNDAFENNIRAWRSNATIVALDAALALSFDDEAAAQETLSTLQSDIDLIDAFVLTSEGQVLASFNPGNHDGGGYAPDSSTLPQDYKRIQDDTLTLAEPVKYESETTRWIVTRYKLDSLHQMQQNNIAFAASVGGIGVLLAILISIPLRILIQRPIQELATVARGVSESKDYSQRARRITQDELGELTDVFNQMLDRVQHHRQELQQAHDLLDEKVRLRTDELETALARVEAASAAKSDFLANMSHEIRTPMTAILGYADLLSGDFASKPEQASDAVQTIHANANHLLTIINDILDVSKIEAGQMAVEAIDTSPCQIISEVLSLVRPRATGKGVNVLVKYDTPVPDCIQSDPTRLRQILLNLMGNAIKFTEVGNVTIHALCDADAQIMTLAVVDTGIGMSPKQCETIAKFEAFTQADASTTRKFGGTGLGLRISKALSQMLGGDITVSSVEGKGSTFTVKVATGELVSIKMLEPAEAMATKPEVHRGKHKASLSNAPDKALEGLSILLAEDGPDNQRLIRFHLEKAGAKVTVCENGLVAAETLEASDESQLPDVVLMDMQMPELDGYGATRRLREGGFAVPIIALTAHAMEGDRQKCVDAGCDDYLTKPIEKTKLVQSCADWAAHQTAKSADDLRA